jgi:hypothetical protein
MARKSDRQAMVQAPAANHKETADTMQETFSLSNICPQIGRGFNRFCPIILLLKPACLIVLQALHPRGRWLLCCISRFLSIVMVGSVA